MNNHYHFKSQVKYVMDDRFLIEDFLYLSHTDWPMADLSYCSWESWRACGPARAGNTLTHLDFPVPSLPLPLSSSETLDEERRWERFCTKLAFIKMQDCADLQRPRLMTKETDEESDNYVCHLFTRDRIPLYRSLINHSSPRTCQWRGECTFVRLQSRVDTTASTPVQRNLIQTPS